MIYSTYLKIGLFFHEIYHWIFYTLLFWQFPIEIKFDWNEIKGHIRTDGYCIPRTNFHVRFLALRFFFVYYAPIICYFLIMLTWFLVESKIYIYFTFIINMLSTGMIAPSEKDHRDEQEALKLFVYGAKYHDTYAENTNKPID